MQKYFFIEREKLLKLFRVCPECGHRLGSTQLELSRLQLLSASCVESALSDTHPSKGGRARTLPLHIHANASLEATVQPRGDGRNRYNEQAKVALFSKTFYIEVFKWTEPAVEKVYRSHQELVLKRIGEGLNLAADGAYDSRGYSALICKVVLLDLRTNLILHTEVLRR
ncbi:hypothetical protein OSTOST_06339 [Ostertagia ostertagi]